ncbi:MAG TPA: glycosyltransferase family 2 protein [Acidiferrobacteraceae bacterium]|nr:glycosyltransferase family 2 protein [Acidiferrobacteraceae bacterium]HEX20125.1 glycosyltransferase family 2 protein [Acidiferrobacteraceae bacterium]
MNIPTSDSVNTVRVAVIIPVYNESASIADIIERVLQQHYDQLIVVDDGSTDDTVNIVSAMPVTLLQNDGNCGKGVSLIHGMRYALEQGADLIVTLDGDGQHLPEDIPRLLAPAIENLQLLVIGSRLHDKKAFPKKRYYANCIANFWISWAAGHAIGDSQSGFRVYPASLLQQARIKKISGNSFVFESEVLIEAARHGYAILDVPIAAIYEQHARPSHFRPVLDISKIVLMVAWKLFTRGMYLQGLYRALR